MATENNKAGQARGRVINFHRIYIGIDPGVNGGLALLSGDHVEAIKMPDTEKEVWEWFDEVSTDFRDKCLMRALIEKVGGYAPNKRNKGKSNTGSTMFTFGTSYGCLRMAAVASCMVLDSVSPRKWQNFFGIKGREGETQSEYKNRLKAKAQKLFPEVRVTLHTADALLIALYNKKNPTRFKINGD